MKCPLDEAIRQEIKQHDATVVSGHDNLDHKCHGAKKEEETNEEKNSGGKKKKNEKPLHFPGAQRRYASNKAPKIDGESHATTSGKCDKLADAHQLSLPTLSLFTARVSPKGERRQRQALSVMECLRERHIKDRNVRNQTRNKLA
jgi:hypothetical protein